MFTHKQQGVLKGMLAGLGATVVLLGLAVSSAPSMLLPASNPPQDYLAHALRWDLLVIACLAINIGALARHRFFTPQDIDGGGLTTGTPTAHILQSTLQNTLEQAVLAVGTHMVWAASMPAHWQAAVPVAAMLFVVGRVLFWRGYANGAPSRALGFALTFYPSVLLLFAAAVHMLVGG